MSKLIYFAGPLFSQAEREFNLRLTADLESIGFDVFLPQRDGVESRIEPYKSMSKDDRRRCMFELDRDKIIDCDIFLFILDGRVPDEGAAVELEIAYMAKQQRQKLIVGLHTDSRAAFIGAKINPMLYIPLEFIAETYSELTDYLQRIED